MIYRERTTPDVVESHDHKDNLLRLADFLDRLPRDQFDMMTWAQDVHECGTVGCALGWAALSGEVPGLGWAIHPHNSGWVVPVVNGTASGWDAAGQELFGERAHDVFALSDFDAPSFNAGPKAYAKYLRKIANELGSPGGAHLTPMESEMDAKTSGVLAVLRRLSANVEFASLKREAGEASDALSELIEACQLLEELWEAGCDMDQAVQKVAAAAAVARCAPAELAKEPQ